MNILIYGFAAKYRIDTYNYYATHYNFKMYFFEESDTCNLHNINELDSLLKFEPHIVPGPGDVFGKWFKGFYHLLKEEKPDVVLVPEFKVVALQALFYRLFLRKKPKIISICDDSYDMLTNMNDFSFKHRLMRRLIVPLLDNIICVEDKSTQWYHQRYGKGFWLPIIREEKPTIEKYKKVIPLSNTLNKKYQLEGKKVILYVGRFVAFKNLKTLIESYNRMKEDAVLVLIGDGKGDDANEIKKCASSSPKKMIMTGTLSGDELFAWYNISDVFTLVSTLEPFGAVVNEALLAGNKCIVSDRAGAKCLIDKSNGIVVDPLNVDQIARGLDALMSEITKQESIVYKGNLMNIRLDDCMDKLKEIF